VDGSNTTVMIKVEMKPTFLSVHFFLPSLIVMYIQVKQLLKQKKKM